MAAKKAKTIIKAVKKSQVKRLSKTTLRSALVAGLKEKTGRKDIKFDAAPQVATKAIGTVSIKDRAGYPVARPKGSVDPKDWVTHEGVKVEVDFSRAPWLPDDWGQGVKTTHPNSRSTKGGGGILTSYVSPDMKVFYHKTKVEELVGRPLTTKDGFNGQVRLAQLQAKQAVQLARMQIKEISKNGGQSDVIGTDPDHEFFKLLSPSERKCLPSKDEFHFCVVSARRATKLEGVRDIFMVQTQLIEAGVTPTWYVDADSLKDYQALGLRAVVGGKLTPSRNKALKDAKSKGKVCVQLSDDISAWEYREGEKATERTDDAVNAAHAAARRYIVSPVAAARFMLAKMRSADSPKPKLGGVYMLGSCARTFAGDAFSRYHFILGDFFVVDKGSSVLFDEEMRLKEDYDFTCAHIKAHGSVMRCNRMTLNVKHYSNGGGAVTNRDNKGVEEKRNIGILNRKWPGCFRANPKRKNEVIMRWKGSTDADEEGEDAFDEKASASKAAAKPGTAKSKKGVEAAKKTAVKKTIAKKVALPSDVSPTAVLVRTAKAANQPYIEERCKQAAGRKVEDVLGSVKFQKGALRSKSVYGLADLKYDLKTGYLAVKTARKAGGA
eukprot:TRINITY_DN94601_c0_g1_i1.p1 TRINITY_DN94601_c0_g1~~TRINITY_DN94601_c0_g1_i1.p1  ORF type:complete len:608 (-),score=165.05 TRINITY_DN94601_c0_g1_i1:51-1874(-)